MSFGSSGLVISPNLNVRDEKDQTPLSLAVWIGEYDIALDLLRAGADIECQMSNGLTLLHCCILRNDLTGAMFLLRNSARIDIRYNTLSFKVS